MYDIKLDLEIQDIVETKSIIIYTPNKKGQLPNSFNKAMIPSSVPMNIRWYMGYVESETIPQLDDFNAFEIPIAIAIGLQSFNIINGEVKKYNQYFEMNSDEEKLEIDMSDEDLNNQLVSKKFLMFYELNFIFNEKLKELTRYYGEEEKTFEYQLVEAKEIIKLSETDDFDATNYPILNSICTLRKVPIMDIALKVIANHDEYMLEVGKLLGIKYQIKDTIETSLTNDDLNTLLNTFKSL